MAIIVEDGTEVANANSYASASALADYADLRGITLTTDEDVLLIRAMDALYGRSWIGERVTTTQALEWPRTGVYVDNQLRASNEIPRELFYGQLALAVAADTIDLMPTRAANATGPIIENRVEGAVTRKYANPGTVSPVAAVSEAEALLRVLEFRSGLRVVRA